MHTTGYLNKLIAPSEDCAAVAKLTAKVGSVAALQYEMLSDAYAMTGDELLLAVTGVRRDVPRDEWDALHIELFSKGQPCLRASPLVKTHGWAVHYDAQGRIAMVDPSSQRFAELSTDIGITQLRGMRSKRA